MSVTRAELEAMSKDELVEEIVEMSQTVDRLETLVEVSIEKRKATDERVEDLADRVENLESENERLRQRLETVQPTTEGVEGLVAYAQRKRNGEDIVTLSPEEIRGAYDCSEGYAYKLANGEYVVDEYSWLIPGDELRQYGDLERDRSGEPKRLAIDFAGRQSSGVPLKRYNNDSADEGV